jgi:hypothetical protein
MRALRHFGGRELAVGHGGVAMQIGVHFRLWGFTDILTVMA